VHGPARGRPLSPPTPPHSFASLGWPVSSQASSTCSKRCFYLLVKGRLHELLPPLFLSLGGLLATAVVIALYARVRHAEPLFAAWALALGLFGQMGAAVHGAHWFAQVGTPGLSGPAGSHLPDPVDTLGFLAFGVVGISVFVFAWLIVRSGSLPRERGYLGYVLALALIVLILGVLCINNTSSLLILLPGAVANLLATPAWNIWLGLRFLRTGTA
jgi:hypothetical protein